MENYTIDILSTTSLKCSFERQIYKIHFCLNLAAHWQLTEFSIKRIAAGQYVKKSSIGL